MPFKRELADIYNVHMNKVADHLGLSIRRADNMATVGAVMSDVWKGIYGAQVVIADCTDMNPNVFYEMGIVHAIGKPMVLIMQQSKDGVPFDIAHLRIITYNRSPKGLKELRQKLEETIRGILPIY